MSREVRRVPPSWEHPKGKDGEYVPLHDGSFSKEIALWDEGNKKWQEGFYLDKDEWQTKTRDMNNYSYEEWDIPRPVEVEYMPDWSESERTHYQMYESTTEGTPISPVMDSPESLARWLTDNKASAGAGRPASYNAWLATIRAGWAASFEGPLDNLISGVEAQGRRSSSSVGPWIK